jgi:DNA polymerase-1
MIEFPGGGCLVETVDELPDLDCVADLYADFETTSFDDRLDALDPWHNCWAAGVAVTADDAPGAWYVPVRHRGGPNLPVDAVRAWWADVCGGASRWTNHNVKYDAHVSACDMGWLPDWPCGTTLRCTLTAAKVLDSDRGFGRGGYDLGALSRDWLGEDISHHEAELRRWLGESKDYGSVPPSVMAPYACQDVMTVRRLAGYLDARTPEECRRVAAMEVDLTSVLLRMERSGMSVDPVELMVAEVQHSQRLLDIDAELHRLTGRSVNPSSPDQLFDLLINQYGLPVLGWTEEDDDGNPAGNPSFDKHALALYALHPDAPRDVVALVREARKLTQLLGLFVRPYQELALLTGGSYLLHPSFNQMVRTGRMSCRAPNMQQLSKLAKRLIHPRRGNAFLSLDQSQIEFRVIVHYIQNQRCIDAYRADPDTDFHDLMARTAGIGRDPAKTLNFMMGYGGGKKKAVKAMSVNTDVVGDVARAVDEAVAAGRLDPSQRASALERLGRERGEAVYDGYHAALPELKPTSRRAAAVCADRGYVRNVHGRYRRLPADKAHHAFNTLCQGEAADIQKERTVAAARACLGTPVEVVGNVHDEVVFEGPAECMRDPRTKAALCWLLETVDTPLRVPLRCAVGYSEQHWAEASTDVRKGGASAPLRYDASEINKGDPLCHLR